jgi:hypothetical protein
MIPRSLRSWLLAAALGWAWPSWAGAQQSAELAVIDAQLQLGEWQQARAAALERIDAELASPSAAGCLAATVARLAVAEAGLKQREDAIWHWSTAQNLDAHALSPEELAVYGPVGELLASHPLRRVFEPPAGLTVHRQTEKGIDPSRRISGEIPRISAPAAAVLAAGNLYIQAVIDEDGRLREPIVMGGGSPAVNYQVLESLRGWRYAPARHNFHRLAVFRNIIVDHSEIKPDLWLRAAGPNLWGRTLANTGSPGRRLPDTGHPPVPETSRPNGPP